LAPGEIMKVDTGNVAAFEASVSYSSEMVKGFANVLFGGEGLFLTTLKGPGKVWLQTMSISELASRIIPFIPDRS
ncbi:MAG: AIM24 family protein, partial [Clostridia bacterium]|nr:AIM24 family protein [Clostridia bacterium]